MPRVIVPAGRRVVVNATVNYRPANSGLQYRRHSMRCRAYAANSDSGFTAFGDFAVADGGQSEWVANDSSYNPSSVTVGGSVTNNTGAAKEFQINLNIQSFNVLPANDPAKWDMTATIQVAS
jgi:hypothetical protein